MTTATKQANGLYQVDGTLLTCELRPLALAAAAASHTQSLTTWPKRFGHLNPLAITELAKSNLLTGIALPSSAKDSDSDFVCNACLSGKGHRLPFPEQASSRATAPLQRVHSDILTMSTLSLSGCQYAITFVYDYLRKLWTKPSLWLPSLMLLSPARTSSL